jgi:hypothetical protein
MNSALKSLKSEMIWLFANRYERIMHSDRPEVFNRLKNMSISANQKNLVKDLHSDIAILKEKIGRKKDMLRRNNVYKAGKDENLRQKKSPKRFLMFLKS